MHYASRSLMEFEINQVAILVRVEGSDPDGEFTLSLEYAASADWVVYPDRTDWADFICRIVFNRFEDQIREALIESSRLCLP